jgi:hypothetical protein
VSNQTKWMMDKPLLQDGKQWVLMTTKTIGHDV